LIVDEQDVDFLPVAHDVLRAAHDLSPGYRWSHMRSADSSCSVLTGLAR
jgi:hypothetical protein